MVGNFSCKRLLLEGGANPTIYSIDLDASKQYCLSGGILELSRIANVFFGAGSARLLNVAPYELDPAEHENPFLHLIECLASRPKQEGLEKIGVFTATWCKHQRDRLSQERMSTCCIFWATSPSFATSHASC